MTLIEWLEKWPYRGVYKGACYIVPDGLPSALRREAWRLTDYRVSSVAAGSIYLMPKTQGCYCGQNNTKQVIFTD